MCPFTTGVRVGMLSLQIFGFAQRLAGIAVRDWFFSSDTIAFFFSHQRLLASDLFHIFF